MASNSNNKSAKRRITWLSVLMIAFLLSSCDDFLTVEPKESISDELAISEELSLKTALRGAYRSLGSSGYYGGTYVQLGFVPSGDVVYQVFNNLQDLNFLPEDGAFQGAWSAIYRTINITNHIIEKAPALTDVNLTDEERNQVLGEAHFIRGLAYFDLARAFGGVPLKLNATTDIAADATLGRGTLVETYQQVLTDLEIAGNLLPAGVNRVRATRDAVQALKARYFLYNNQWEQAIVAATSVINQSEQYRLVQPYSDWFRNGVTQADESIFEIAFSAQNVNDLRTPMSLLARGGEYRYRPSDGVVSALKNSLTGGDRLALLDSATQSGTTLYAGALYYRSPATDPSYVLRIAEQYLIRAEARAQLDDPAGAIDDLDIIRERAGLAPSEAVTKGQILDAILAERRLEFLWEAHRYFDLTRTGRLKEEIQSLKPNLSINDKHNLLPIPSNEVILGGLTQNPGY
jgi:tetratricopeptide (TPR) repeat protein